MADPNGGVSDSRGVSFQVGGQLSRGNGRELKPSTPPPPLELSGAQGVAPDVISGSGSPGALDARKATLGPGSRVRTVSASDKQKLGHRRVREGEVTYKKIETSTIMGAIQLGIAYAVGSEASKPKRDVLLNDFYTVETIEFPRQGGQITPAHHYSDFRMKIYATVGFKYFRALFGIEPDDFLVSMCHSPLRELSNAGASGSIFYLSHDDEFIVKTVQHKEGDLLQKLLPGYFMNLNQNPRTLLPKFFGLYCYHCNSKNIRLVVMNNLLPSSIKMHQRYDLKGSTYKRKANKVERSKKSPTYKDLDFIEQHPEGLMLEAPTYSALMQTIQNDCRVLESFMIMDYSLLIGVHNLDLAAKEKSDLAIKRADVDRTESTGSSGVGGGGGLVSGDGTSLTRTRSINRQRLVAHSTAMESIQAESEPIDEQHDVPPGGIPARNSKGERLLLFLGIIDILQSYRLKKRLEHSFKAMVHDGNTISVHRPDFYSKRFFEFMGKRVFNKIASPLRHSPSKRRQGHAGRSVRGQTSNEQRTETAASSSQPPGPDSHLPVSAQSSAEKYCEGDTVSSETVLQGHVTHVTVRHGDSAGASPPVLRPADTSLDTVSVSDIRLDNACSASLSVSQASLQMHNHHLGAPLRHVGWTPPLSADGSTPTWTEGTPSYTESSSSGDVGSPAKSLMTSTSTTVQQVTSAVSRDSAMGEVPRSSNSSYRDSQMGEANSVTVRVVNI